MFWHKTWPSERKIKMVDRDILVATERVFPDQLTCAMTGSVRVVWPKFLWVAGHGAIGLAGVVLYPQLDALMVFLILTAITVCAGHSVGMHRLLIHRSFETQRWLARLLVWLGTLVGMAGPFGMIKAHDMRDWHQRQVSCPDHAAHRAGFWKDAWWQLCCEFALAHPPLFVIVAEQKDDRFYRWLERTWMLQQVPVALVLYAVGGWAFVLWGISLRIFVSLTGHWMVGHFAHNAGSQSWRVDGVAVQGYDLPRLSLITFGENWHGNHHAFPYSAQLGVGSGQSDIGFRFIQFLEWAGLAWNIKRAGDEPAREGLSKIAGLQDTPGRTLTSPS